MKRDPDQLAAINVSRNAVVSAGAGSGKTSVLTSRYLRLVMEERIPVSRILALTFTRKAAAEMYERIYNTLVTEAGDPFVAEQLADFDSAVISTLDSFCSSIARNGCARFGVPPTFQIDERALRVSADRLALEFLTEHASEPAIADLIRLNKLGPLWHEGFARLAMDHFRVSDERSIVDYLPEQERFLRAETDRLEQAMGSAVATIAGLDAVGLKSLQSVISLAEAIDPNHDLSPGQVRALAFARKPSGKHDNVAICKELMDELRDSVPRFELATETLARLDQARRLAELTDRFRERVLAEKRRTGLLSYHDVTGLAIRVLSDDHTLRDYYKTRFRAIMIDEFQDNNEEQKALLYLLAEEASAHSPGVPPPTALDPAKLFFVGDEKQSIYRFRGADVSVFRTLAAELGGSGGAAPDAPADDTALRLGANYRSEPGLIRAFNEIFRLVFADAEAEYEARFEPLRWRAASEGVTPRVELWDLVPRPGKDDRYLEDADAETFHIASFIRSSVESGSLLVAGEPDEDGARRARPARWSDFAILMRSSGNQIRLERTLRLFGIPYVSQAARSLFLEAPVNDIYQVLQLVLYPSDRVAYAGYLRSPLVGVSDEGIVRQLLSTAALLDPCDGLSADDRRRMDLGRARYLELSSMADSVPITELLHHIWFRWGYRYHLLRRSEYVPYLEYYELFREMANTWEADGLAAFLDEVRGHIGQNEKLEETEILRGESTGVQIMTIHKSKGLEFPIVIVANAGNRGRNDSVSSAPYHWSDERGLAWNTGLLPDGAVREKAANYLYTHELEESQLQSRAELKRLLYVAATRAEDHLIFSGVLHDTDSALSGIAGPAFEQAREALAGADDVILETRELEPVLVEEERKAFRSGGTRDIDDLAARYQTLAVVDRAFDPAEVTATTLNSVAMEAGAMEAGATEAGATDAVPAVDALDGSIPATTRAFALEAAARARARLTGPLAVLEAEAHPVDDIIAKHDLATMFGTYCHWCIEHADELDGRAPAPERLPAALRPERGVSSAELEGLYRAGFELAQGFLSSDVAARLAGAITVDHELAFLLDAGGGEYRVGLEPRLIRGQIDLVAEFADTVMVVDFKTDRVLDPTHYLVQMAIYHDAAREIYRKPVSAVLFALRSGTSIPIPFDT